MHCTIPAPTPPPSSFRRALSARRKIGRIRVFLHNGGRGEEAFAVAVTLRMYIPWGKDDHAGGLDVMKERKVVVNLE
jgi:hypothetical protein